jgi:hypothetical protein
MKTAVLFRLLKLLGSIIKKRRALPRGALFALTATID